MPPRILGIHGKKGSGKSTLAIGLQRHLGWERVVVRPLAAPIKEMCVDVLGLDPASVYGTDEQKNRPTHVRWHQMGVAGDGTAMSGRQVMQELGTRVFRGLVGEDVWLQCLLRRVARLDAHAALVVVDDVRFPNEVSGIQAAGGRVVSLTRSALGGDPHVSETALDGYVGFDAVVDNAGMTPAATLEAALDALGAWGWKREILAAGRASA